MNCDELVIFRLGIELERRVLDFPFLDFAVRFTISNSTIRKVTMDANFVLLFGILFFAYIYFYLNSKQYLRLENFAVGGTGYPPLEVSWPGGVVSPPAFDNTASRIRYGMSTSGTRV